MFIKHALQLSLCLGWCDPPCGVLRTSANQSVRVTLDLQLAKALGHRQNYFNMHLNSIEYEFLKVLATLVKLTCINTLAGHAVGCCDLPDQVRHFLPDINVYAISNFLTSSFVLDIYF